MLSFKNTLMLAVFGLFLMILPAAAQQQEKLPADLLEQLNQRDQEQKQTPQTREPAPVTDPLLNERKAEPVIRNLEDIPEEALADAHNFENDCNQDQHRATHYDCECLASRYLERRIELGPDAPGNIVFMDVQSECPNLPGAAGFAYTQCIGQPISFFPEAHDPEKYCSCIGNAYAKLFARSGKLPNSRAMVQMRTTAALSCTEQPPGVPVIVPPIR